MKKYDIISFNDHVYGINSEDLCSIYVVIGTNKAMVIDTGMPSDNKILPLIRKLTDKELIVCLTHGHYDHIGHIQEFDKVYMGMEDLPNFDINPENQKYVKQLISLHDEMIFDLGNLKIKAIKTPGHTPGSYTFIDLFDKYLFTGDQFGSGCGVWMQVFDALPLSKYIESIDNFINYLKNNYDLDIHDWTYLGGHYGQEKTSRLGFNPLNTEMVLNLKELSKRLLLDQIELIPSDAMKFHNEQSYYASYQNAEMIIRKSNIK